jgi:hypothetical protein
MGAAYGRRIGTDFALPKTGEIEALVGPFEQHRSFLPVSDVNAWS